MKDSIPTRELDNNISGSTQWHRRRQISHPLK